MKTWLEQSITLQQIDWNSAAGNLKDQELCKATEHIHSSLKTHHQHTYLNYRVYIIEFTAHKFISLKDTLGCSARVQLADSQKTNIGINHTLCFGFDHMSTNFLHCSSVIDEHGDVVLTWFAGTPSKYFCLSLYLIWRVPPFSMSAHAEVTSFSFSPVKLKFTYTLNSITLVFKKAKDEISIYRTNQTTSYR